MQPPTSVCHDSCPRTLQHALEWNDLAAATRTVSLNVHSLVRAAFPVAWQTKLSYASLNRSSMVASNTICPCHLACNEYTTLWRQACLTS